MSAAGESSRPLWRDIAPAPERSGGRSRAPGEALLELDEAALRQRLADVPLESDCAARDSAASLYSRRRTGSALAFASLNRP